MVNSSTHIVVMAGGSGTRFWPLSRRRRPKQVLDLDGKGTLLGRTYERIRRIAPPQQWWMVVGSAHSDACMRAAPDVPGDQVLIEPTARNTAPAVALAATQILHRDPGATMVVLPADHYVADFNAFTDAIETASHAAAQGAIVTLGIRPTYPETGFGYIHRDETDSPFPGVFRAKRFVEKPERAVAQGYLHSGNFDWNAGIFVMRADTYMKEVKRQLPQLFGEMEGLKAHIGRADYPSMLAACYDSISPVSVDYGIMEGAEKVYVVPVECGWSDVGSLAALSAVHETDENGNVLIGGALAVDSTDNVVYTTGGHLVGVLGVEGLVVIHTDDATLVVPAERAQDVRVMVEQLEKRKWSEYL